jgi:hypothetical protein
MARKIVLAMSAVGLVIGAAAPGTHARADSPAVRVGMLTCNVDSGWGFVFGSTRELRCNFAPKPHAIEHYTGTISKYGVDIGYMQGGVIVWGVLAPTTDLQAGSLAGSYGGATADASVGVGAGANVLVGGSNHSISLQPVSIEGNSGLNVAAGIAAITLHYEPTAQIGAVPPAAH